MFLAPASAPPVMHIMHMHRRVICCCATCLYYCSIVQFHQGEHNTLRRGVNCDLGAITILGMRFDVSLSRVYYTQICWCSAQQ